MAVQEQPRFLTIKDVATELATSQSQVRALISSGDLPAIQIGGRGYLKFPTFIAEQLRV
jgi:excisionase family DNA binding protein